MPLVLFHQFKYFFNLFFLLIALSQIVPALRVGFLISFVAPLAFVLIVTMVKELSDDMSRRNKDYEINSCKYMKIDVNAGLIAKMPAESFGVGDMILLLQSNTPPF